MAAPRNNHNKKKRRVTSDYTPDHSFNIANARTLHEEDVRINSIDIYFVSGRSQGQYFADVKFSSAPIWSSSGSNNDGSPNVQGSLELTLNGPGVTKAVRKSLRAVNSLPGMNVFFGWGAQFSDIKSNIHISPLPDTHVVPTSNWDGHKSKTY
jgi:hypothetical protein